MFPLPLLIQTRPSVLARGLLLLLHLAAAAALFVLPSFAMLAGWALLSASLGLAWKPFEVLRLRAREDGQLERWGEDAWKPVHLQADSVVRPWLIVLRWREGKNVHSLMLPPDALSREEHRRLRLWLRWKAVVASANGEVVTIQAASDALQ